MKKLPKKAKRKTGPVFIYSCKNCRFFEVHNYGDAVRCTDLKKEWTNINPATFETPELCKFLSPELKKMLRKEKLEQLNDIRPTL
jgi:hypothetical protein